MTAWTTPAAVSAGDQFPAATYNTQVKDNLLHLKERDPLLTNNSGGALAAGDVCVQDTAANQQVVKSSSAGQAGPVYVALAAVTAGSTGYFRTHGHAAVVNVTGAVSRGNLLQTSSTAGVAMAGTVNPFGIALTAAAGPGAGTVEALLLNDYGLVKVLTTLGDLAYRDAIGITRLPGNPLTTRKFLRSDGTGSAANAPAWDTLGRADLPTLPAVSVYHNANQSLGNGTPVALKFNSERYDTDGLHYGTRLNSATLTDLTGTVDKTNGSTTLTGVGTAFTSEVAVGMALKVPGTADEVRVVTAIASNTSLTVQRAFSNTATGQTASVYNEALVCRTAGKYRVWALVHFASNATGYRYIRFQKVAADGTLTNWGLNLVAPVNGNSTATGMARTIELAVNDYLVVLAFQNSGGALDVPAQGNETPEFGGEWIGP